MDQRLVALDVHHRVAAAAFRDFCNAVRAARMFRAGHFHATKFCATSQMRVSSVATMTSPTISTLALLDDVLDEGLACDQGQRLAGEPRRSVPGGNDAEYFHAAHLATAGG